MLASPAIRRFAAALRPVLCGGAFVLLAGAVSPASALPYTQIIIFGDSLSDDGNVTHLVSSKFDVNYPGGDFNYSDGRFTNSSDTTPASTAYVGVWHEQLSRRFLGIKPSATDSLDGGTDYAYGGATTANGTQTRTVDQNTVPFGGGELSITINNMGQQVTDYISAVNTAADPDALYLVWGGGNDLFDDDSAANVTTAVNNVGGLVTRLAQAGARNFLVPNVPPLGDIPDYNSGNATTAANLNAASASFRDQLNTVLDTTISNLSAQGITIAVSRLDVYTIFLKIIAQADAYGFVNVTDSAQGANVDCDEYLFWDDIHPTTAGHFQVAKAAADTLLHGFPAFFSGQAGLQGDYYYLAFADGQPFGYYSDQFFPTLFSTTLGFEYFIDAADSANGGYLYDFGLNTFLYTSPALYPYLYDFNAGAFFYLYTNASTPESRVFYNFGTGQYVFSAN